MNYIKYNQYQLCSCVFTKTYLRFKYYKHYKQRFYSSVTQSDDFAIGYVPNVIEKGKYEKWEKHLLSTNINQTERPFVMIMPPPNITGTLHLGHALTLTIQDVLMRWNRMRGIDTLWVPGMDHAGIATQVVVEKKLWQEKRQTRHDIGRKKFEDKVWKWKQQKGAIISEQMKKLGALPHWSMEYFTMDEQQSKAVNEAFIRLFDSGLIYRSDYLVNWSCVLQSAISDVEVEHVPVTGRTAIALPGYSNTVDFGLLTKFAYKLCETDGEVIVSTTRPETVLGDVAIAVHPSDNRYSALKGQHVLHPFRNKKIPIILDDFVDPTFGTGAVKVTPAHDPVDFLVAKRHDLPTVQVINERGNIIFKGEFSGEKRFIARELIVKRLQSLGLHRGTEEHAMQVPMCSRSGDVVEHLVRPQWFVSCRQMAENAAREVREGRLVIKPENFERVWYQWLENIRDWCISRQLWWGHRIPAYRCKTSSSENNRIWIAARNEQEAREKAASKLGANVNEISVEQDEDVLDTWFSSALLPFSAFGWPDKTDKFRHFYPTNVLETGHDILFFWVARMAMLGGQLTGQLPFNQVLLHGIICDAHGRKMSKSLGNVIAPEDVIRGITTENLTKQTENLHAAGLLSAVELSRAVAGQRKMFPTGIPECGADALRFTLLSHNVQNYFINFDVSECHTNKLFCNKIWQACKFLRLAYDKVSNSQKFTPVDVKDLTIMDKWILSRLSFTVTEVNKSLSEYDFHIATLTLKQFLYGNFCDVYLESTKPGLRLSDQVIAKCHVYTLGRCLDVTLRCLAPFMPFLTQELYEKLPMEIKEEQWEDVASATFPKDISLRDLQLEKEVEIALNTAATIRRLQKLANISAKCSKAYIITSRDVYSNLLPIIKTLSGCENITLTSDVSGKDALGTSVSDTVGNHSTVHLLLPQAVTTIDTRLAKKIEKLTAEVEKIQKMIHADGYKTKAPLKVQEGHSQKLASLQDELHKLMQILKS